MAFTALANALMPVRTPVVEHGWILVDDEPAFRATPGAAAPARLLPSGDAYFLLWQRARELLVPEATRRARLWTTRVWPGAPLVNGEVAGVWRRSAGRVSIDLWRRLTAAEWAAVEAEAMSLPLPGRIVVERTVNDAP